MTSPPKSELRGERMTGTTMAGSEQDGKHDVGEQSSIDSLRVALYSHCAAQPPETVFTQQSLLATNIIPSNSVLLLQQLTMALSKSGHLKTMQRNGQICWRCVATSTMSVYRNLDSDVSLVYSYIESAGTEGMLASTLNRRTNFHKATMDKCIKVLEQKRLIKTVPNYRHPKRKTFMLWGLHPAEDVTGGPFYGGGELDEEFVNVLSWWIERYIIARSFYFPPEKIRDGRKRRRSNKHGNSSDHTMTTEEAEDMRREEFERPAPPIKEVGKDRSKYMLPFCPSYKSYPHIGQITQAVNETAFAKEKMKISDIQQLVNTLRWDGKIEKTYQHDENDPVTYRAVKNPLIQTEAPGPGLLRTSEEENGPQAIKVLLNGLTEAPCGRCPVFDICEDGGLVSAKSCPYFEEWLAF